MGDILGTTISSSSISTELCCVNDMRNNLNASQQLAWRNAVEAALLWLAVPDWQKIKADCSVVTCTGSWTPPMYGWAQTNALQTTSAGDSVAFSIYGASVYVVTFWQADNTSTYTVTIDGVTSPTISTATGAYQTILGGVFQDYGPQITRSYGSDEQTHTVTVTCTSADSNDPCYFLFATATGPLPPTTTLRPLVLAGNTIRFTAAGYSAFGGSDTLVAQFNAHLKDAVHELASDGLHVVLVDAARYYKPGGANTQSDGVHPTGTGDAFIARAFVRAPVR
jgi:hypothetical protein